MRFRFSVVCQFVLFWGLSFGLVFPARAWLSTADLQKTCEAALQDPTSQNPSFTLCTGLLLGIIITDSVEKHLICLPPEVDTKAGLRLFIDRAKNEKNKGTEGVVTMLRAFEEKYPCPKR